MAGRLLRVRDGSHSARVTSVELFFDLVFVFAITQISHTLLEHLTWRGAAEAGLLLMTIWWGWVYTAWCTNWLEPDHPSVRLALFCLMAAGLVLSTSLPHAFEDRALVFALAYAVFQLGRTGFILAAVRGDRPLFVNFLRIGVWLGVAAAIWIAGALVAPEQRLAVWGVALAIEYAGPAAGFWTPGLGRTPTGVWNIEGAHLAERCGLFLIICLGESILVTGATFARLGWTPEVVTAFLVAFAGSVAMWWIYFSAAAEAASERIAASDDPGAMGRLAFTYVPILLVAGIVVSAVGDELVLAHPTGHGAPATAAAILGGAAIYLAGAVAFKRAVFGVWSASRLSGLLALAALGPAAPHMAPLALAAAANGVLIVVAGWEALAVSRQTE